MAFDISYTNTPDGRLMSVNAGGLGAPPPVAGPGGLDTSFLSELARGKMDAERQRRAREAEMAKLQRKGMRLDLEAKRQANKQPRPAMKQPMRDPFAELEGAAPVVETRMGPQGQMYEYVDPRAAALANAKAQMLGAGDKAFMGGRLRSTSSQFTGDDWTTPLRTNF